MIAGFSSVWNGLYCDATSLLQDLTQSADEAAKPAAIGTESDF
jgi:hypothetical protein